MEDCDSLTKKNLAIIESMRTECSFLFVLLVSYQIVT